MHHKSLTLATALTLVLITTLSLVTSCSKSTPLQDRDNPFDPQNSTGGDALQLTATVSPNQILLSWTQPQDMDIADYSLLQGSGPDGPWSDLVTVAANSAPTASFIYNYPDPTQSHWFKVQAFATNGDFSLTSLAVAATVTVGPTVIVGDTLSSLVSRYTALTIVASTGDSVLVGLGPDYANAQRLSLAGAGVPTVVNMDFGPAASDTTFELRVKTFTAGGGAYVTTRDLAVGFGPQHTISGANPLELARRVNDLLIPAAGVARMRFAPSEAALAAAIWTPAADTLFGYALDDAAITQEIWGEYESDFGFSTTERVIVRPNLLTDATYSLNLPPDRLVSDLTVSAGFSAAATEVRLAENPDFTAVPWQPYASTLDFQLSVGAGTKIVYAQFRNDWTQSDILADYCIYLAQGPDVKILSPSAGNAVLGGNILLMLGTTNPGTLAAIDSVKVDLADGLGFRPVTGTDNWQLSWDVPHFTADTDLVLRARVWADTLMVTDVVTVTVTQLTVAITTPAEGDRIVGGTTVDLAGTAGGLLNGAAVDSVTVDIGLVHLLARGGNSWTTTWSPPTVGADSLQTIAATVWAGGDTATTSIGVTLTP